jgi:hypothetical protein
MLETVGSVDSKKWGVWEGELPMCYWSATCARHVDTTANRDKTALIKLSNSVVTLYSRVRVQHCILTRATKSTLLKLILLRTTHYGLV